jgi:hypothetical protein
LPSRAVGIALALSIAMKKSSKHLSIHSETIRILTDVRAIQGGKVPNGPNEPWTTRDSKGLPCTNEPTSTQTCPSQTQPH